MHAIVKTKSIPDPYSLALVFIHVKFNMQSTLTKVYAESKHLVMYSYYISMEIFVSPSLFLKEFGETKLKFN